MSAVELLLSAAVATLLLYHVPGARILGWPLMLMATLVHELGHGLTAMFVGGSFRRLEVWSNGSGAATYAGNFSRPSRALVAAGGPLGPPLAALLLFGAATEPRWAHIALAVLAGALVLSALIWLRNLFGFVFTLLLGAALAALTWQASDPVAQFSCAFLAIQMSLSVFSRGDYLFKSAANTTAGLMPSDTAQIAAALFGPYWFWGALIGALSLAILGCGLWLVARTAIAL